MNAHRHHGRGRLRRPRTALGTLAALLLAAACVPGTDGSGAAGTGGAAVTATPDPGKAGKVTLTVWDQQTRGGTNAEIERLNKEFEKKYPNVTIKRVARSFNDLKKTLKLALSGDNPPDVVQANQGYADMVAFARAGMLTPLDSYAGLYSWNTRFPQTLLNLNRVAPDGKRFGTGQLYGISQEGEYIGVYYNKKVLRKADLEPPRTWQDLTAALPKLKQAGELPVQFGNLDKYPAIHTFGVLQGQAAGSAEPVRETVFGRGGGFDTDATRTAARTLADWAKKGYFPKGANGKGYDDAAKQFADGKGAFLITGTWQLADLRKPMGDDLGFMPPPPAAGTQPVTTGGEGLPWSITSKSDHPQVAAAYLDFLTDAHAAKVMTEEGVLPVVPGKAAGKLDPDTPNGQMVAGWEKLNAADGLVPYLDYTTPTFYDTLSADLQGVLSGDLGPDEFAERTQKEYAEFRAQQRTDGADDDGEDGGDGGDTE
ncbi:ABC transporter substrate-binding protein [Streptomyces sp. NPDC006925]|uniref:ABC transporter substrate-binding protein n=1 Tax=Streptomyces sp. NPDC006925 TaxID=3364768 RepID=UPI0036C592EA